jgi:hypothetical protein
MYYSDDFAVLDRAGLLHPYPQPLGVRGPLSTRQERVDPASIGAAIGAEPLPVGALVLTAHREGALWRPKELSLGIAVMETMRHTVCGRRRPADAMDVLTASLRDALRWRSDRDEADAVVRAVMRRL